MSKTSSQVKARWNAKAYDNIKLYVPKGRKEIIKEHTQKNGESINGYINRLIAEDLKIKE